MPDANAIRAGGAYVVIGGDNKPLKATLDQSRADVRRYAQNVRDVQQSIKSGTAQGRDTSALSAILGGQKERAQTAAAQVQARQALNERLQQWKAIRAEADRAADSERAAIRAPAAAGGARAGGAPGGAGGDEDPIQAGMHYLHGIMRVGVYAHAAKLAVDLVDASIKAAHGDWGGFEESIKNTPIIGVGWEIGRTIRSWIPAFREADEAAERLANKTMEDAQHLARWLQSQKTLQEDLIHLRQSTGLLGLSGSARGRQEIENEFANRMRELKSEGNSGDPRVQALVQALKVWRETALDAIARSVRESMQMEEAQRTVRLDEFVYRASHTPAQVQYNEFAKEINEAVHFGRLAVEEATRMLEQKRKELLPNEAEKILAKLFKDREAATPEANRIKDSLKSAEEKVEDYRSRLAELQRLSLITPAQATVALAKYKESVQPREPAIMPLAGGTFSPYAAWGLAGGGGDMVEIRHNTKRTADASERGAKAFENLAAAMGQVLSWK